ncbi:putative pilus assembly protein CpaE [Trichinella spiralis]|uniref:putative pilus assembly protein CpaE n=1 Tax=Trichinella spiralis TaxID=6334 RepID=UPI0001EFDA90|nr:putative pilus assembly protein CpaE [Trichinella spiralis]
MESQLSEQSVSDHAANLSQLGGQLLPMRQSEMLLTAQLPRLIEPHRSDITPVMVQFRRDLGQQTQMFIINHAPSDIVCCCYGHSIALARSSRFCCLLCGFG